MPTFLLSCHADPGTAFRIRLESYLIATPPPPRSNHIHNDALCRYKKLADEDTKRYHAQMEDFYKDEITALCTVEDDAEQGRSSYTSTPISSLPPAMAAMSGGMLPDAALGAALGMPFQQFPNANNNLLSYLQQNAFQQQQQQQQQQQGNPFLMSLMYQQQQMQQQQQQVRNALVAKGRVRLKSNQVLRSTFVSK